MPEVARAQLYSVAGLNKPAPKLFANECEGFVAVPLFNANLRVGIELHNLARARAHVYGQVPFEVIGPPSKPEPEAMLTTVPLLAPVLYATQLLFWKNSNAAVVVL